MATPSMFNRSYAELPTAGVNTRVMDSRGSLANRAATPVGRSTMDPARIAGMISRGTASKNKIAGATFMQNLQDSMIGRQLNERQMRLREQSVAEERRRYDLEQKQKQDELAKREQFRKAQLDVMRGTMTPPSGVQLPSTQTPSSSLSGTTGDAAAMGKQALGMMSPSLSNLQPEPGMPANPLPGLPAPLPGSPALPAAAMKPSGLDTIQTPTALPGTQSAGLSGTSLPASPTAPGLSEEESLKKAHEAYKASGYTDNSVFQSHFNSFPSEKSRLLTSPTYVPQKGTDRPVSVMTQSEALASLNSKPIPAPVMPQEQQSFGDSIQNAYSGVRNFALRNPLVKIRS